MAVGVRSVLWQVRSAVLPGGVAATDGRLHPWIAHELERKNGWTLVEAAGDATPDGMQRLLNFYAWDCDGLRDDVREVVVETIGDETSGVLIVDETGFLKKGSTCAGVARQYSGTAGRIENSRESGCSWRTPRRRVGR